MRAKLWVGGLMAAACLLAQSPGGPRGRGPGFGPGGPGFGPGGRGGAPVVAGAPYSGVEVRSSQQVLANGNVIQHQTSINVFRDGSGRQRTESTRQRPDGTTESEVMISDPVAGKIYHLDVKNKVAYAMPAHFRTSSTTTSTATPRTRPVDANVKIEALAARTLNGVSASGSRITHTIPAGSMGNSQAIETVRETWMADDLKVPVMTKMTDPRTGTRTTELTNINRVEPDAALFQVPADYTVKQGHGGPGGPPPRPGDRGPGGQRQ